MVSLWNVDILDVCYFNSRFAVNYSKLNYDFFLFVFLETFNLHGLNRYNEYPSKDERLCSR